MSSMPASTLPRWTPIFVDFLRSDVVPLTLLVWGRIEGTMAEGTEDR